jgi:hypothetical protein
MARITDSGATDLDETRRLLYMALLASRTKRYNLAASLVNAIHHHQGDDETPLDELFDKAVAAVEGEPDGLAWARGQVARINALEI